MYVKCFQIDDAIKAYVKDGQYEIASDLCKEKNETEKAIKILLLDKDGKLLPNALQLSLECTVQNVPLELGCSVNAIAQRTAQFYHDIGKTGKAIDCVEHFNDYKDKVSFFKKAGLIDEAADVLFKAKEYNDLYRLLKGQERYDRGAEMAEKLHNDQVCCEFLLLSAKKKLLCPDQWTKQVKAKEADILEKACNKLHHDNTTLTLQVKLLCGILREEPMVCFNKCKKFININHFGAIQALNAAVCLKEPNLSLHKITVIVNCLQVAYDIVHEINTFQKLSSQHLLQCRKFYQFEKSEEKFFLPPGQFYWMPALAKIQLKEKDSDGMMQFSIIMTYNIIEQHIKGIAQKWLQLDLEKVLINIMTSQPYGSLNSVLDYKTLDMQKFVKRCYEMSDYLLCCINLIEISHYHCKYGSDVVGKIGNWEKLSGNATSRILDIFSPPWNYFFKFDENDIEVVKKSKITCDCLHKRLHPDDKFKNDINAFLHNWRILKLIGCDISTLEKCLENEEFKLKSKFENMEMVNDQLNNKKESSVELRSQEELKVEKSETASKEKAKELPKEKDVKFETDKEKPLENCGQKKDIEECSKDKETLNNDNKKFNKPNIQDEVPAVFVKTESGYSHSFNVWLQGCAHLDNGNFMGFAEGVIKRLFILIAKRKSLKPKISLQNITSILEVICIGLFGSLKAAGMHANKINPLILFPKFYEHSVTSINFTTHAFLTLVATSVAKSKDLKQLYYSCLHLLQRILQLLVGYIEPSFNVLRHASLKNVHNNGFERCLVLCLSLFGNLWPLLNETKRLFMLYLNEMVTICTTLYSDTQITENLPKDLSAAVQGLNKIESTKDIFIILHNIQQSNESYMVSLQYQVQTRVFSSNKTEPHKFPTFTLVSLRNVASNPQKTKQGQQHHLQHNKKSNALMPNSQLQKSTKPVEKPMNYTAAVKQPMNEVPSSINSSAQLSDINTTITSKMSHASQTTNQSHQKCEISSSEKDTPITNSGSSLSTETFQSPNDTPSLQANEAIPIPSMQVEHTLPIDGGPNLKSSIPDEFIGPETNSCNQLQSTLKGVPVDSYSPQSNTDESVLHFETHDMEASLSLPSLQSHSNVGNYELDLLQEKPHLPQEFNDEAAATSTNTEIQPTDTSVSIPIAHTDLLAAVSYDDGIDKAEMTASTSNHQPHYAASHSTVTKTTAFQSKLKPDAKPFEPALKSATPFPPSSNLQQTEGPTLQNTYQPSSNFSALPSFASFEANTIPHPSSNYNLQPPLPSFKANAIPNVEPLAFLYGQYIPLGIPNPIMQFIPFNWPFYSSMPYMSTDNLPYPDIELETLQYYSPSRNTEALSDESRQNTSVYPNYCDACDCTFEDEQSKKNHYTSAEHQHNTKLHLAYQETVNMYAKEIGDAKRIAGSAKIYTGGSYADQIIQAQVDKIKECKDRYDRERGRIEDNHDWSDGQSLVECYVNEIKLLKKEYEQLKISKATGPFL